MTSSSQSDSRWLVSSVKSMFSSSEMYFKKFILIFLFIGFCYSTEVTQKKGFCIKSWMEKELVQQTYKYTEYDYYDYHCRYYGRCERTGTRHVNIDVPHERVECCPGYQNITVHGNIFDCEPICIPPCSNGHCSEPGNCTCYIGYRHASSSHCVPHCQPECVNGKCISPGVCQCNEGYNQVNTSYCAPHCSLGCINGACVGPEECRCNSGYVYTIYPFVCNPGCKNECINATCVDINVCQCLEGYAKEDHSKPNICVPFCSLECINGKCSSPDKCSCDEGFHLGNESWNVCLPNCNCTNGYCIKPNECKCYDNFTLNGDGECEPICNECVNATCTEPFVCECLDGFKKYNDSVCIPECSDCANGICIEPEVCSCFPGYEEDSDSCQPVCDFGCANGICTAPNSCSCESGYEKIEENLCFPVCGHNCSNCSETDCLLVERTEITVQAGLIAFLKLNLKVNCSELYETYNTTCGLLPGNTSNCTEPPLECSALRYSKETFKFLCQWKDKLGLANITSTPYLESLYEDVLYMERLNASTAIYKNLPTIVLLPKHLHYGEINCDICLYSLDSEWQDTNKITFRLLPCPPLQKEQNISNHDNFSKYVMVGILCLTVLALLTGLFIILNKGKLHEYLVSSKYGRENGMNLPMDQICDESILPLEAGN